MRFYNIEKSGIKTAVDEMQFEKIYKPQGWRIVSDAETGEPISSSDRDAEAKIKNRNRAKKPLADKFDDGLFKERGNGKV